jgi:hypothetical protein
MRKPGDLGEKGFVATTNNYNSPAMSGYNLGAEYFADTFIRYATIFKELSSAPAGTIGLDFAKAAWLSDNWYDATTNTWNTVPTPNDFNDPNICNVPGNICEGGEYQMISFPAQKTVYLEFGDPQGTAIQNYWPSNPKPTGEYTKWQLRDSIHEVASAASDDALEMLETAWNSFKHKASALDPNTRDSLMSLLKQASEAWSRGRMEEESAKHTTFGHDGHHKEAQMAPWSAACTDFATAQLYSQMVTTKLNQD